MKPLTIHEHEGGECPVSEDDQVLVYVRGGFWASIVMSAKDLEWKHSGNGNDIILYINLHDTVTQWIFSKDAR